MKKALLTGILCFLSAWLSASSGWIALIAEDLDNWTAKPELGHWSVKDGVLTGANTSLMKGSQLWTNQKFTDFALEGEFRFEGDIDSGVFVKSNRYQVNIGQSSSLKVDKTCSIYAPKDGKGKYPGQAEGVEELLIEGGWNKFRIESRGAHIIVMLNGREVLDYETLEMPETGPIGLQVHANKHMKIEFRMLRVKSVE